MLFCNVQRLWRSRTSRANTTRSYSNRGSGQYCRPWLEQLEDRILPSGLFSDPVITTNPGGGTTAIVTGNFINGDSRPDVLALNGGSGHDLMLQLFVSDAQGQLTPSGSPIDTGSSAAFVHSAVTGDFNGDDNLDVAFAARTSTGTEQIEVWLGHGDGTFTQAADSPLAAVEPAGMVTANFNGHLDLAFADAGALGATVLLNDGSGNFTPKALLAPGGGTSAIAVAAGDFTGNGNMDLAVSSADNNYVDVFLGDGHGNFQAVTGNPFLSFAIGGPDGLQVGDFDSDNLLDVAVVGGDGATEGAVTVLKGDGTGKLTQQPATALGPFSATDVVVADFNGDHRPDLFLTPVSQPPQVLLGNGNDGFTDGGPVNIAALNYPNAHPIVATADFNGDGKPDVVLVDNQGNLEVLLNQLGPAATQMALTSNSASPSVYGQAVTFTATVTAQSGTPTGNVTFTLDGGTPVTVPLTNGQATFTLSLLSPAAHTVVVTYAAQGGFAAGSASLTQTVRVAETMFWSGLGPDNLWSDGANWVGGTAPLPGDHLIFPADAAQLTNVNDYPQGSFFYALTFAPGANGGGSSATCAISGNPIRIGAGGLTDRWPAAGPFGLAPRVSLGLDIAIDAPAGFINVQAGNALSLTGQVSDDPAFPAGIVKSGKGSLVLAGQNTYLGPTVIGAGFVTASHSGAFGAGAVMVSAPATLSLAGAAVLTNPLALAGKLFDASTGEIWSGPIALTGSAAVIDVIQPPSSLVSPLTLSGTVTGSFAVQKQGSGALVLAGHNAYTGGTSIQAGTVRVQDSAGLGAASDSAVVAADATLDLAGGVTIAQSVKLADPTALLRSAGGSNVLSGSVTLTGIGHIEVDAGQLLINGRVAGPPSRIIIVGSSTQACGLTKLGAGTLVLSNANTLGLAPRSFFGPGIATEVTDGVLELRNANALGGPKGGGIQVDDGATLALNIAPTARTAAPVLAQALVIAGAGFENQGAVRDLSAARWTGTIDMTGLSFMAVDANSTLSLENVIRDSFASLAAHTPAGIGKLDGGELDLLGANVYSGQTMIVQGTLLLANAQALPGDATVSSGAVLEVRQTPGILAETFPHGLTLLDGSTLATATASAGQLGPPPLPLSVTWSGNVTQAGSVSLMVNANTTLTLSGFVSGTDAASLLKSGSGSLVLGGSSAATFASVLTANGPNRITVQDGTLSLSQDAMTVSLGTGFVPAVGQSFTLIARQPSAQIVGTFAGSPDGFTFQVDSMTFALSYGRQAGIGRANGNVTITRIA